MHFTYPSATSSLLLLHKGGKPWSAALGLLEGPWVALKREGACTRGGQGGFLHNKCKWPHLP